MLARLKGAVRPWFFLLLEQSPRAFCGYRRWRKIGRSATVSRSTTLVIDGPPGCANSFAREAWLRTNPHIELASHSHSAAHIRRAVQLGVPTVVLMRDPEDSITSIVARREGDPVAQAKAFVRFGRHALKAADTVVLATFDDVINRLGDVVDLVNKEYGTSFVRFDHEDPAENQAVMRAIEIFSTMVFGEEEAAKRGAKPSEDRKTAQAAVRARLREPDLAPLITEGRRLMAQLQARARTLPEPA